LSFTILPAFSALALDLRYDSLKGGMTVSGIDASTAISSVNTGTNVSMVANGDTTGTFTDTSFTAFGLYSPTVNSVNNTGKIDLMANGGVPSAGGTSFVTAEGLFSGGPVTNSGIINVTGASGDNSTVNLYGIQTIDTVTNSGNINVKAMSGSSSDDAAYGIVSPGGSSAVTNRGNMSVMAISSDNSTANAFGIISNGVLINSGNLNTIASNGNNSTAIAFGFQSGGLVTNSGNINAVTTNGDNSIAQAFGAISGGAATNSGNVSATASTGSNSSAIAFGLQSGGSMTNSGNINVAATGGSTQVIGLSSGGTMTNSGSISAIATGSGNSPAIAYGIISSDAVTNSGNLNVTAMGGSGSTSLAYGIQSQSGGTVANSGFITVTATSGGGIPGAAYGVFVPNGGTLTNTGIIRTIGDNAYEVYASSGTLNLSNRYNINLDGDPAKGSIYVNSGATMNLNNTQLSATAVGGRFNTDYRIFDGAGTVNGSFGSVMQPRNRAVTLLYHDQGTAGSSDDTVSLAYHPTTSPVLEGVDVLRRAVNYAIDTVRQQQVTSLLNSVLPEGGTTRLAVSDTIRNDASRGFISTSPANGAFFIPYYANLDKDSSSLSYNANITGFMTGYERDLGRHQFGFHLGYGYADIGFKGFEFPDNTDEELHILTFGLHGMTRHGNWTVRGDLSGFYGRHKYSGITGLNLDVRENASYNSVGITDTIMVGYIVESGSNVFLPEIGLNHIWVLQDGFTGQPSSSLLGWQTNYSSVDNNQLQARASLRWLGRLAVNDLPLIPSVAIGGRYRITDDSLALQQSVSGSAPVEVVTGQERAAATAAVSIAIKRGSIATELAYNGEYSTENTLHGFWLKLAYAF